MAQIGTFTRDDDGVFNGTIRTLSLNVKARLIPADSSSNEKAPPCACWRVVLRSAPPGSGPRRRTRRITR